MSSTAATHEHSFRERVAIPNRLAGAVTGYTDYEACACGERRRTILWERGGEHGSTWTAHLFGVDLTVTRISVDRWQAMLRSAAGMEPVTSPTCPSRQAAQAWAVAQVSK